MKRSRRIFMTTLMLAMVVPLAHSSAGTPDDACTLAANAEGWGLLSADQARPFFEAPLPVDAAVPHAQSEITNNTAIGRAFVADPGLVARANFEEPRDIAPPNSAPVYTVPQPVFPAGAPTAQPGGLRANSFGIGGALDPSGQFSLGAARADGVADDSPPATQSRIRIEELAFSPGNNAAGIKAPADAGAGPNARGFVTVGSISTRSESLYDINDGSVHSLAASSLSEVEIAGVIKFRTIEVVAQTTSGQKPAKSVTMNIEGFELQGRPMPLDAKTLEAANAILKPQNFELLIGDSQATSNVDGEVARVQGFTLRGYRDEGGDRRRINLIFGYARATSKCLANDFLAGGEEEPTDLGGSVAVTSEPAAAEPSVLGETTSLPSVDTGAAAPAAPDVALGPPAVRRVLVPASYTVRWNWSKFRIKWWRLGDIFTVIGTFGLFPLAGFLLWQRRRLAGSRS
jgi:hypothetical protein